MKDHCPAGFRTIRPETFRPQTLRLSDLPLPGWWNGRHAGLKIQWSVMAVWVRVPSSLQKKNRYDSI